MAMIRPRAWRGKLRVAAVFLAGLLVGGSGLAAAGALPDSAQHAAHQAFDRVGIDVPDPERYHGPECGEEIKRNHGAYVRDDHSLATSRCGKPAKAEKSEQGDDDADGGAAKERGPCQGPPPWAGPGKQPMTAEEKAAAQAERAAQCGDEPDGSDERSAEGSEPDGTTTTTEAATTTTEATTTSEATTTTTGATTGS